LQSGTNAGAGLTTTLDIAALVAALVWPLLLLVLALLFRDRLVEAARLMAPHLKSLSVGIVSIEFAEARPLSLQMVGAVDLRHAGQSTDVNDSTLRSFYAQVSEPSRVDYAVVDLGGGHEWLTSRLFILSVILARMRGLRALVFTETTGHVRRRLVGVSEHDKVRWRLAARFPWLEAALAHAESAVWPQHPPGMSVVAAGPIISNDDGRLEWPGGSPEPAAQLLRAFLDEIQLAPAAAMPSDDWQALPASNPPRTEHAQWLTAAALEQILGPALDQSSISLTELHRSDELTKARLLLAQSGRWLALTREDRIFDRLVDRLSITDTLAQNCVKSSAAR
jgi:hypothetical protein